MDIIKALESRYSTKEFDSTRSIDQQLMEQLKRALQLSPSSTNIQPWHFIIAQSEQGKARVAKATQGVFGFNEHKVLAASAVVVFATRIAADKDYMDHLIRLEDLAGRYSTQQQKDQTYSGRAMFSDMHLYDLKDQQHWFEKQVYLNLGSFLLAVAALGLDAVPMEGCDTRILNEEFELIDKGFTATLIVAVGYHAQSDFNAKLPKSRLSLGEIIEVI